MAAGREERHWWTRAWDWASHLGTAIWLASGVVGVVTVAFGVVRQIVGGLTWPIALMTFGGAMTAISAVGYIHARKVAEPTSAAATPMSGETPTGSVPLSRSGSHTRSGSSSGAASTATPLAPAAADSLRARLEEELRKGEMLKERLPSVFNVGTLGILSGELPTTEQEIDGWEEGVQRLLRNDEPRKRAGFLSDVPPVPLMGAVGLAGMTTDLGRRLEHRLHRLEAIIKRLP